MKRCFLRHAFRYWMGRNETPGDAAPLQAAHKAYRASGGSFKALVAALHARGLHVAIISGDGHEPTQQLASQLGIDTYHAEVATAALDAGARIVNDIWGLRTPDGGWNAALARLVPIRSFWSVGIARDASTVSLDASLSASV